MMKSLVCIGILLTICVTISFGASSIGSYKDPKNPGKCTINASLILSPGESAKDPNGCGRISCGKDSIAELVSCGVEAVKGCKMGDYIDKSLPYPECCKRHVIC